MLEDQESESEAIQISINKSKKPSYPQNAHSTKLIRKRQKVTGEKVHLKKSSSSINPRISNMLQNELSSSALLNDLMSKPLNFGQPENKKILIEQKIWEKKTIAHLGVQLVKEVRKQKRIPLDLKSQAMAKCNAKRSNISSIRSLKRRK